jgi:nitrate reductase gamma subunit
MFTAALAFMILGLARHLLVALWDMSQMFRRAGDKHIPTGQVVTATRKWLLPIDRLKNRWFFSLTTMLFHVAIILVPIFLAGHIALWQQNLGLSWPALPNWLATALTFLALMGAVALVTERILSRDSRALSRMQDYALPLMIAVPFSSGLLVMHPAWNPFAFDPTLLVHVISANVLLVMIPVTKLSHMVLLPITQLVSELAWHFPPDAGSKVGVALRKESEPI